MEAGQDAAGVVPTEVEDVLLRVVAVVPVQAALSPVVHLETACVQGVAVICVFKLID